MTQSATEEIEYEDVITERGYYDRECSNPDYSFSEWNYETWGKLPVFKKVTWSNDAEHRVKPLGPLYMYPTGQEVQSTEIMIYGRAISEGVYQWQTRCYDIHPELMYIKYYKDFINVINPPDYSPQGTFPVVDTLLDMRLKIKDLKVNLSSSVAEYATAADTFVHLARDLHNVYKNAKRGRLGKAYSDLKILKTVASAHLLHDFGISPLARDIGRSIGAVSSQAQKPVVRRFVVSKSSQSFDKTGDTVRFWKTSQRHVCYVHFEPNWAPITIGNPIEWAWELIPFSFVVDWAIPIGDWLSSLDAMKGIKSTYSTITTKQDYKAVLRRPSTETTQNTPASYEKKMHGRVWSLSVPVPPFPGYEPSESLRNVAQGLSLLRLIHDDL